MSDIIRKTFAMLVCLADGLTLFLSASAWEWICSRITLLFESCAETQGTAAVQFYSEHIECVCC